MFPIIGNVLLKFFVPEGVVRFRGRGVLTSFVPVPKTAMNKEDSFIFRQDDVRLAGQGADVFPEPVSGAVQHRADKHLRFGVLAPDSAHIP